MNGLTIHSTLADMVNADPNAARVLESHHLDYCCGGHDTLEQSCQAKGIDPEEVLAQIGANSAEDGADTSWRELGLHDLVHHIRTTHHEYLHAELPRLCALAAKVEQVHGSNHPELMSISRCVTLLRDDLEPHLAKEERILFPMIEQLAAATQTAPEFHCGSLSNPIRQMLVEHDRAGELLAELRSLTNQFELPADACASYSQLYRGLEALEHDTHMHVHKENNLLFPQVLEREHQLRTH